MKNLIRKSVEAMTGYVPGEQPDDQDIVKLNTNENPHLCSPEVHDILRAIEDERARQAEGPDDDESPGGTASDGGHYVM